ncbi:uncharacterized protein Z518_00373 [Rhinocladiella mackenziei CBS 650.93]|uniref:C2H2-type domain-containing protein n=1 Tax=Rhinocladiella mackenziei CBS 650.93 TaxID=1442369 RepID=A0A0D2ITB3_9EURO|nr:uncharacterized protein Z518_00373 [Rhinocladiella mackenziei CBS 650.93]KIX09294.1 hypothetical protein Z518_00373 [Rhinocladiella mackenziei CBS 650.93]
MYQCETCTATFWYQDDCEDHMDDYGHRPKCETCTRAFRTQRACDQHMNDTDHWAPRFECETCTKEFLSQKAANQHMNALGHWAPKIPCETCGLKFHTQTAANQHMTKQAHYKNYCKDCGLRFQNENNLRMHLNSKTHRGTSVSCPFCKANYTSASGLTHHLETGSCPRAPKLNRESIFHMVRERDPHGVITNKQIEWHKEENIKYSATSRAFNGSSWECYMCHKEFNAVNALNAHLNSSVHKQKVYRCPNMKGKCGKQFVSLAGLFNHLESEACAFMRFEKVQRQVQDVLQGRKLIALS